MVIESKLPIGKALPFQKQVNRLLNLMTSFESQWLWAMFRPVTTEW